MRGVRLWATITAGAVALLAAIVLALAFTAPPASAYSQWAHDGATGCSCHDQGTPTDATCTACHTGFKSYPGMNCWSCHAPGQDTSTLSSPSSACSQECHLWDSTQKSVQHRDHARHEPAPRVHQRLPRLPSHQRQHHQSGVQPAPSGHGPRVHAVRRLPLLAAEARRQGRVHAVPRQRDRLPPLPGEQPRLQEVRLLPRDEARRRQDRGQQVRQLPQGQRQPAAPALLVHHQEVRVRRLSQQQAPRQRRQQVGQELPHVPQRQVPRAADAALQVGVHPLPHDGPEALQRVPVHPLSSPCRP